MNARALAIGSAGVIAAGLFLVMRPASAHDEPAALWSPGVNTGAVDWSLVRYFSAREFGGLLASVDPRIIYAADAMRARLGAPLQISKAEGAIARFELSAAPSRHYAVGRKSDALDLHPIGASLWACYRAALLVPAIGGFGVYPDWNTPGIHIDCRPRKPDGSMALWIGESVAGRQVYAGWDAARVQGMA